jgi:hypothetical protein
MHEGVEIRVGICTLHLDHNRLDARRCAFCSQPQMGRAA